jgi:FtsP/CotA-like multicopper oxidase with cupredoxin domain
MSNSCVRHVAVKLRTGHEGVIQIGERVRLHIVSNQPELTHMMHLHGHTFTVLANNGKPLAGSPIHVDTLLVAPHTTRDVAFVADNPGLWMLHCHILMHAKLGMDMMINYAGITTPYRVGSESVNIPE